MATGPHLFCVEKKVKSRVNVFLFFLCSPPHRWESGTDGIIRVVSFAPSIRMGKIFGNFDKQGGGAIGNFPPKKSNFTKKCSNFKMKIRYIPELTYL